jgi:hypothetical protein
VNWTNVGLIAAALAALVGAGVAIYRSRPQKDLDAKTAKKIEVETKREVWDLDRDRTIRLIRLERYIGEDIEYHHKDRLYHLQMRDLLEIAKTEGFLPVDTVIPEPPVPPELPKFDDDV